MYNVQNSQLTMHKHKTVCSRCTMEVLTFHHRNAISGRPFVAQRAVPAGEDWLLCGWLSWQQHHRNILPRIICFIGQTRQRGTTKTPPKLSWCDMVAFMNLEKTQQPNNTLTNRLTTSPKSTRNQNIRFQTTRNPSARSKAAAAI